LLIAGIRGGRFPAARRFPRRLSAAFLLGRSRRARAGHAERALSADAWLARLGAAEELRGGVNRDRLRLGLLGLDRLGGLDHLARLRLDRFGLDDLDRLLARQSRRRRGGLHHRTLEDAQAAAAIALDAEET